VAKEKVAVPPVLAAEYDVTVDKGACWSTTIGTLTDVVRPARLVAWSVNSYCPSCSTC
jgi:hypothetical protein